MKTANRQTLQLLPGALCCLLSAACASDAECDPGYYLRGSVCAVDDRDAAPSALDAGVRRTDAGGTADDAGAAADDAGGVGDDAGAGGALPDDDTSLFGASCSDDETHAECGGAADYCAKMDPTLDGICTARGCADDASICPEDFSCLDLSVFMPDLPSICVPAS